MSFYSLIRNEADGSATLDIDGELVCERDWWTGGGQVVARNLRRRLDECGPVTVRINSPGGDVFAGAELYSALMDHKARGSVTVKVTGIAASAASVVAMAGDRVLMSPVAYMMIHDPWTVAQGNAREFEKQAAILREIGEGIVAAYQKKTGKARDEITAMLAAETYMNAQRCVDEGFADGILYEDAPQKASPAAMMRASAHGRGAVLAMLKLRDDAAKPAATDIRILGDDTAKPVAPVAPAAPAACAEPTLPEPLFGGGSGPCPPAAPVAPAACAEHMLPEPSFGGGSGPCPRALALAEASLALAAAAAL